MDQTGKTAARLDRPAPLRIVALAPNDWNGVWMNRQHLLSRLAEHHSIVYSNGALHWWERGGERFRSSCWRSSVALRDGVMLDRPGRLALRTERVPAWDAFVRRRTARRWRRALNGRPGPLVAYVFHPDFAEYVPEIRADYLVYHAYDLYTTMSGATDEHRQAEQWLLDRADLVLASSEETGANLRTRRTGPVQVLRNAVDWARYAVPPSPCETLRDVPRPRIGYVGALNRKVDFNLLLALASREPGWQFVLVGEPVGLAAADEARLQALVERPNVHALGSVPQSSVPAVLAELDVGLVCYTRSGWALACDPLKLYEYFAAGLPVVSTDIEAVRRYADQIAVATTVDEWGAAIRAALAGTGPGTAESRQNVARANGWDARGAELAKLLATLGGLV